MMTAVFAGVGFQNEGGLDDKVTADKTTDPLLYRSQLQFAAFSFYSATFFLCINTFMGNFFNTLIVFQQERPCFIREQSNKMYSVFAYYMSKNVAEIPVTLLNPLLLILIVYFSFGFQRTAEQFFLLYLILCLLAVTAQSLGYMLSAMFQEE